MRASEFIRESQNKITLQELYKGDFPDRDESFWEFITTSDLDKPLQVNVLSNFKLKMILSSQYRVEHIDEISDLLQDDQQEIVNHYMQLPNLKNQIIVISDDMIVDGNHRALAAALSGSSIQCVDLSDLEEEELDEMALTAYQPIGDFNKPGPFRQVDRRLVPHPTNQLKTQKFLENTPYDFRLFFSNIPGTGKYSESGPMSTDSIQQIFKDQAAQIIEGSEDAINVVFVGNSGADKVMLTPWLMAHRFGHAIQAGARRNQGWNAWSEAEQQFFRSVNVMLDENYGKQIRSPSGYGTVPGYKSPSMVNSLTPEYNALFNAIGTQRSSRTNKIKRPYEFLYELFAQYLKDGKITLNPLPNDLGYGRKVFGNPANYLKLKSEVSDAASRQEISQMLANDMGYMFDDVLNNSVGKIFVM